MYLRTVKYPNGNTFTPVAIFSCDSCGIEMPESNNFYRGKDGEHLCMVCGLALNKVDPENAARAFGFCEPYIAGIGPDKKVYIWEKTKQAPWIRKESNNRNTPEYVLFRKNVFDRDNYTCQNCGQVGGELNAHHIKTFKHHPELRTETSNGITLCVSCHKKEHRKNGRGQGY